MHLKRISFCVCFSFCPNGEPNSVLITPTYGQNHFVSAKCGTFLCLFAIKLFEKGGRDGERTTKRIVCLVVKKRNKVSGRGWKMKGETWVCLQMKGEGWGTWRVEGHGREGITVGTGS